MNISVNNTFLKNIFSFLLPAVIITVCQIDLISQQTEISTTGISIFSFDDHTIPFKRNLYLTMVPPEKYSGNPVIRRGPPGSVDAYSADCVGSIIRDGGKYRMWYTACNNPGAVGSRTTGYQVAYAESNDGIKWVKPNLGLTSFNGNKNNNLIGLSPFIDHRLSEPNQVLVLYEPEEKDPYRRYKMVVYGRYYDATDIDKKAPHATIYPYFSADGLNWKLAVPPPKGTVFDETEAPITAKQVFEIGGLYKFDGIYYVVGQLVGPDSFMPNGDPAGRMMAAHWSSDFINWSQDRAFSFMRYGYRSIRENFQEAHVPASVWNRGNVLLGIYGLWQGAAQRSEYRMNLGFLVSNNGIHFREPIHDYVFLEAGQRLEDWDRFGLVRCQAFENIGDKTYIYYGTWDLTNRTIDPSISAGSSNAIGLAIMPRDRFGYLSIRHKGEGGLFTSVPFSLRSPSSNLYLNIDGVGEDAYVMVELIDKSGMGIDGYSGKDSAEVRVSGLHTKVNFRAKNNASLPNLPFRMRVRFLGKASEKLRFFAAYIE